MERSIRWVRDTEDLAAVAARVGRGPLCVDTEADSMHHYPEKVCLMQLSYAGRDYLVDPLGGLDPTALGSVLADPAVRKILHGADYDLRVLHRDFGLQMRGLFDTMVAARLSGERSVGLAALLEKHFGVLLDKRYQRADWSRRPLPEEMQEYAVRDTRYLEPLAALLDGELRRLGRAEWAEEEFLRLEAVRWNPPADGEGFRRIKGAGRLGRLELAVLRELAAFRETEARRRDRPPFKVLSNDLLISIARAAPRSSDPLAGVPGMPARWERGGGAQQLRAVVRNALGLPESEWPQRPSRRRGASSSVLEKRLRSLARERDRISAELGLEPELIAPRATLEQILEVLERGGSLDEATELRAWQRRLLQPVIEGLGA